MMIWPKNMNASTRNTQKNMFCKIEKNIGKSVTSASTNVIARAAPEAKSNTTNRARLRAKRSYLGCFVTTPRYSLVAAMRTAPIMNVAKSMCVWTRAAITTFLPITGTSRLPIGIPYFLLAPTAGEVDDPAKRQEHVQHDRDDDQKAYDGRERPLEGAVVR